MTLGNSGDLVSCSFCGAGRAEAEAVIGGRLGKLRHRVAAMASAGDMRICDECLELCVEILN